MASQSLSIAPERLPMQGRLASVPEEIQVSPAESSAKRARLEPQGEESVALTTSHACAACEPEQTNYFLSSDGFGGGDAL